MGSSPAVGPRTEPQSPEHGDHDSRASTPLPCDTRAARPPRLLVSASAHSHNAVQATVDLTSAMTAASNPVSPGPSSPPLPQARAQDFVPPTRPSSTPFPHLEQRIEDLRCLGYPDDEIAASLDVHMDDGEDDYEDTSGKAGIDLAQLQVTAASPQSTAAELMDVDSAAKDVGQSISFLRNYISANCDSGPVGLSGMDTTMPITPSLSPSSTVDTYRDSPRWHFDVCLDFFFHNIDNQELILSTIPAFSPPPEKKKTKQQTLFLHHLPMEIQANILDHVFDCRVSPMTKSWPDKRLTKMACFTRVWRTLIQERLYCRLKLRATGLTLSDALIHFAQNPHLRSYVRHVELWFPVFEPKAPPPAFSLVPLQPSVNIEGLSSASYSLLSDNCSLEEAFYFLGTTFPELTVLTLEGGQRKKAPQVRHFMRDGLVGAGGGRCFFDMDVGEAGPSSSPPAPAIPQITTVRTLVCKGQWNLIRSARDFQNIAAALPNLHEWQASYSKPKSKSYLSMATVLPSLPANLTSLDLCLEGDYRQEISFPPYFLKVINKVHFCSALAEATPALQHLSYTGRVCRHFFDLAAHLADPRHTRLKSVELTVKNCCRHVNHWQESGSGVTDLGFIRAFEALVLSAVRSLSRLAKLDHLRIRYVDLEFPVPPLNPFFLLDNGWASGVWSDTIVAELNRVRPNVRWEELSESIGERTLSKDGRLVINAEFPKKRVVSLKLSNYAFLVALATM